VLARGRTQLKRNRLIQDAVWRPRLELSSRNVSQAATSTTSQKTLIIASRPTIAAVKAQTAAHDG
jgi:hypothetical protein